MTGMLITYNELKSYALPVKESQWTNITQSTVEDTILAASQNIVDYIDREMASAYYTEKLQGSDNYSLMLDNYPLQALYTVTQYDGRYVSTSLDPTLFYLDSGAGIIRFKDRTYYKFYPYYDYEVYYKAGYDNIPGPIKHAVALQTVQMLQPMFRGGQNFSEIKLIDGINEQIVDLCEKYKRKRIG